MDYTASVQIITHQLRASHCHCCCCCCQVPAPPALINADLYCRAPDNVLLLLGLLRDEPEGVDDFYVRYGALQVMGALMTACQDKLQVRRLVKTKYNSTENETAHEVELVSFLERGESVWRESIMYLYVQPHICC